MFKTHINQAAQERDMKNKESKKFKALLLRRKFFTDFFLTSITTVTCIILSNLVRYFFMAHTNVKL